MSHAIVALLLAVLVVTLGSCEKTPAPAPEPALVVAIRTTPITYSIDSEGRPSGLEHDLVADFARIAGRKLDLRVMPDDESMLRSLADGRVQLALGWLSPPLAGADRFRATAAYARSRMVLVQHEAGLAADTDDELAGRTLHVASGSHLVQHLHRLRESRPRLQVVERPDPDGLGLLREVAERRLDLAVVDAEVFDIAQNYFPELQVAAELGDPRPVVWLLSARGDDALLVAARAYLAGAEADGTLLRLRDRYLGHVHRLSADAIVEFLSRTRTALPKYQALFKQAQVRTGIDWRMLAALAYQESKWDPLATSPTHVRGMMMLTGETADRLGVTDRLDARQSIIAGAEYLADLRDALPASIGEPDRTWMALAAYNLGMGHLNGARQIAQGMKVDANQWHQMKAVLPLMSRPEYYSRLKSGRARGGEAVIMVENIRAYFDILQRHLPPYDPFRRTEDEALAAKARIMAAPIPAQKPGAARLAPAR